MSFMAAFEFAAREALDDVIADNPVALTVAAFMASRDGHPWKGSATALKTALETNDQTEQRVTAGKKLAPRCPSLRRSVVANANGSTKSRHRAHRG